MARAETAARRRPVPTDAELAALLDELPPGSAIGHLPKWHQRASARLPFMLANEIANQAEQSKEQGSLLFFVEEIFELAYIHFARNEKIRRLTNAGTIPPEPFLAHTDFLAETYSLVNRIGMIRAIASKRITRRAAAELLGVHENTVARWVKDSATVPKLIFELREIMFEQMALLTGRTLEVVKALTPAKRVEILTELRNEYLQNYS